MTIGTNIKKYRKELELTQEELAQQIGVIQSNVHRWERDIVVPSIDTIKKIAKVLNVSVDGLLFSEEERKDLRVTDKELLERIKDLENLNSKDKEALIRLMDLFRKNKPSEKTMKKAQKKIGTMK